ncbi:protein-tyrosine phosphatase [Cellulomonas marina]|uniref:Protein-tyrosine phosphatase n=1 Tax=Cellulomonas marina TaxID=988821 RepID=A0A1I1AA76_9CELL|nr:protein-tyrosine phosphatase [Cellulomonas marina]
MPNLRDVGGRTTAGGGAVPTGLLFRSGELADPGVAADEAVAALRLAVVVDLRTAAEVAQRPDHVPAGVARTHLDVLADQPGDAAAQIAHLLGAPGAAPAEPVVLDAAAHMRETYRDLVLSGSARRGYAAFLRTLLGADGRPVLVHCTAGKDRTGWAVTLVLELAGVDEAGVLEEYLAVRPAVATMFAPLLERVAAAGLDPALVAPMVEVREEYLDTARAVRAERYGTADGYLTEGLGLSDDEVAALRALLRG